MRSRSFTVYIIVLHTFSDANDIEWDHIKAYLRVIERYVQKKVHEMVNISNFHNKSYFLLKAEGTVHK